MKKSLHLSSRHPSPLRRQGLGILRTLVGGVLLFGFSPGVVSGEVPLESGSILAIAGFSPPHTLLEISPEGTVLGEVGLVDPDGLVGAPSGLTVLEGEIWISGISRVLRLDPATGGLSEAFDVDGSVTALADDGEHLWVGAIHPDRLLRFSTDGTLLDAIVLDGVRLLTGLDIDRSAGSSLGVWRFLVPSYVTGHVHIYNATGAEVGVIETNLQPGNLTGLGLEPGGGSMWLTLGTGTNEVVQADLEGKILGEIPGSGLVPGLRGLEVLDGPFFADGFESGDFGAWSLGVP